MASASCDVRLCEGAPEWYRRMADMIKSNEPRTKVQSARGLNQAMLFPDA